MANLRVPGEVQVPSSLPALLHCFHQSTHLYSPWLMSPGIPSLTLLNSSFLPFKPKSWTCPARLCHPVFSQALRRYLLLFSPASPLAMQLFLPDSSSLHTQSAHSHNPSSAQSSELPPANPLCPSSPWPPASAFDRSAQSPSLCEVGPCLDFLYGPEWLLERLLRF